MTYGKLNKATAEYWYLPDMDRLRVFDVRTGDRVAEWNVWDSQKEWASWYFVCLMNLLPMGFTSIFDPIVRDWERFVDKTLRYEFNET